MRHRSLQIQQEGGVRTALTFKRYPIGYFRFAIYRLMLSFIVILIAIFLSIE